LYWAFSDQVAVQRHADGNGVFRPVRDGWRNHDIKGVGLHRERLSGALTKLAAYRGTSCKVDAQDYVIRKINDEVSPEIEEALAAQAQLRDSVLPLIRLLGERDFELLVDLIFSSSGWRRVSAVGGTQKTKDMAIELPSTGERAFIQVKSKTTNGELQEYVAQLPDLPYGRMFFVYHSGPQTIASSDDQVILIGPGRLEQMVVDAGLVGWVIAKVS
jgi:hypothetical protein